MADQREQVYATAVFTDSYLPGAMVLAHSLRDAGTSKKLAVLVTLESLSADTIGALEELYDFVIAIPRRANPRPANLFLMDRPDLLYTFSKIALWRQTQFSKIVYIDADVVALRAPDELFDLDVPFAAAPDVGWPDAFNSGVMVITPNMGDYWALETLAASGDSFDGADQGLLNQYFEHRNWHRLSFTYNCTPNAQYQWEPAYRYYKSSIKMVHFIGSDKPWKMGRHENQNKGHYTELLARWWAVYDKHFKQPVKEYIPGQSFAPSLAVQQVRQRVKGEGIDVYYGVPLEQRIALPPQTEIAPTFHTYQPTPHYQLPPPPPPPPPQHSETPSQQPTPTISVIEPSPERGVQQHEHRDIRDSPPPHHPPSHPARDSEQHGFSPPHMDWDATRSAPPPESRPEAANFPTAQYIFSQDRTFFRAPAAYPEPPKDMYYNVPETKQSPKQGPRAIFPWEEQSNRPQATRIFEEDIQPVFQPEPTIPAALAEDIGESGKLLPSTDFIEPIQFAPQGNAWDNMVGIDRYVRAVIDAQMRRTNRQPDQSGLEDINSVSSTHQESLILTSFPSADDRPSLPVTPAPIRRATFWGNERDEERNLLTAEGVPDQADWDPTDKLEELRRSSLIEVEHLKQPGQKHDIPKRELPERSIESPLPIHHPQPVVQSNFSDDLSDLELNDDEKQKVDLDTKYVLIGEDNGRAIN